MVLSFRENTTPTVETTVVGEGRTLSVPRPLLRFSFISGDNLHFSVVVVREDSEGGVLSTLSVTRKKATP